MHFSRQMAAFVRTGIPITEALEVVEDGSGNKRFRQIVATMREQINNGVPFSDAQATEMAYRCGFEPRYRHGAGEQYFWLWFFKKT